VEHFPQIAGRENRSPSNDRELQCLEPFLQSGTTMSGANPTIGSYKSSAVKIYYTTGSLARCFENKNIFFHNEKWPSLKNV
jgi:hypothetical protein